ncbi:hypothetical protein [Pollutibacter soli]|uniref:hypothetical protein n=1 Tax=Pollutibacter soli TaxID=3034157 RepID=UPI003013753C
MKNFFKASVCVFFILVTASSVHSQEAVKKVSVNFWEGMVVGGYVNEGAFVNFGGPTIKFVSKPWSFGFGILPTMRIKQDKVAKEATKNSAITPTAGFGFTFAYKHLVLQVPFYYNAKTATSNGKWHPGVGLGFRF